jgi:hypothetical protein
MGGVGGNTPLNKLIAKILVAQRRGQDAYLAQTAACLSNDIDSFMPFVVWRIMAIAGDEVLNPPCWICQAKLSFGRVTLLGCLCCWSWYYDGQEPTVDDQNWGCLFRVKIIDLI